MKYSPLNAAKQSPEQEPILTSVRLVGVLLGAFASHDIVSVQLDTEDDAVVVDYEYYKTEDIHYYTDSHVSHSTHLTQLISADGETHNFDKNYVSIVTETTPLNSPKHSEEDELVVRLDSHQRGAAIMEYDDDGVLTVLDETESLDNSLLFIEFVFHTFWEQHAIGQPDSALYAYPCLDTRKLNF